jgi:hypothetical protein
VNRAGQLDRWRVTDTGTPPTGVVGRDRRRPFPIGQQRTILAAQVKKHSNRDWPYDAAQTLFGAWDEAR